MKVDLTPILQAVIILASTLITLYVIPFIKSKVESEKLAKIISWVETLVACADQVYERQQGAEKKQYVLGRLTTILAQYGLSVDTAVLEDLIEAEVLKLHSELKADGVIE